MRYNYREHTLVVVMYCNIFQVPVRVINGELYVRISAHVYNELGEFKVLADAILAIVKNNRATQ